jgi:hypothetical protein
MQYLVCRSPTRLDFYVPVFWFNYILYTIHELVHINKCAGSDFLDGQWQLHKIVMGHQHNDQYVSRIAVFWGSIILLFRASQYCLLTKLDRNYCLFTSCLDHIFFIRGMDFASFCDYDIWFSNCCDSVVFFCFSFYLLFSEKVHWIWRYVIMIQKNVTNYKCEIPFNSDIYKNVTFVI